MPFYLILIHVDSARPAGMRHLRQREGRVVHGQSLIPLFLAVSNGFFHTGQFPVGYAVSLDQPLLPMFFQTIHQLAHSGYRTTDLRALLYNDYNGDGMSPLRLPSINDDARHLNVDQLNVLRKAFQNDIAKSNLITLNIGINDSTQPLMITMETLMADVGVLGNQVAALLDPFNYVKNTLNNINTLIGWCLSDLSMFT